MAIKVILETIHGGSLDEVLDPYGDLLALWPIDDRSFSLLQFIDPYGNAIFNGKQMPQVLQELELLNDRCSRDEQKVMLERIKKLATRCRENPHQYLRFAGD
jgi:hypothetical protein